MENNIPGSLSNSVCPACQEKQSKNDRFIEGYAIVSCLKCGTGFVHPRPDIEEIEEHYRGRAARSDMYCGGGGLKGQFFRHCLAEILKHKKEGKLLDFGCGDCGFLKAATNSGFELYGSDLNPELEKLMPGEDVRFLPGPIQNQGLPDEFFDVIFSSATFEHLLHPGTVLNELVSKLKENGILMITSIPNYRALPVLLGYEDWYDNCPPEHLNYFSEKGLKALVENSNLRVLKSWTYGFDIDLLLRSVLPGYRKLQTKSNCENMAMSKLKTEKSWVQDNIFREGTLSRLVAYAYFKAPFLGMGDKLSVIATKAG